MGDMFHGLGYATAIFGKWHLGIELQSLPTAHGFDEFYGIPPDTSWDSATYVDTATLTHSFDARRPDPRPPGSDRPRQFAAECAEPATQDEESAFSAYVLSTWPLVFIYRVTGSLNRAGGVLVAAP
jgi:arylsulfatase A-like enzyme